MTIVDTNDLLKRVKRIEIKTKALTQGVCAGEYHSAFKGRGMSFAEVREYRTGDDVRDIDWNVTARTTRPHVKVFEEERELTVLLLVDVSGSQDFGIRRRTIRETATELSATIAFSALETGDNTGVIFFSDRIEGYIPPKKGKKHILCILRQLLSMEPKGKKTDIGVALEFLMQVQRRRCVAFLISDFYDTHDYSRQLKIAARRHDLLAIRLQDTLAEALPAAGLIRVRDAETGEEQYIDTSSKKVREAYRRWTENERIRRENLMRTSGTASVTIRTDGDYVKPLLALFAARSKA